MLCRSLLCTQRPRLSTFRLAGHLSPGVPPFSTSTREHRGREAAGSRCEYLSQLHSALRRVCTSFLWRFSKGLNVLYTVARGAVLPACVSTAIPDATGIAVHCDERHAIIYSLPNDGSLFFTSASAAVATVGVESSSLPACPCHVPCTGIAHHRYLQSNSRRKDHLRTLRYPTG